MGKEMNNIPKEAPTIALSNDELFPDTKKSTFLSILTPRHIAGVSRKTFGTTKGCAEVFN